jgi:hypothetical protein
MGAASWEVQDAELFMEELYKSGRCTEALCFHGHGIAWMHSVRNSGLCPKFPESLPFAYFC